MRYTQWKVLRFIRRAFVALLLSSSSARADVIADWNATALSTVTSSEQRPAYASRAMALVHVAMFEAMNFIEGAYVPRLLVKPPMPIGVSSEAAAAAAAYYVLVQLYPAQGAALEALLRDSVATIPDGGEKSSGLIAGRHLGANVYAVLASDRISDGSRTGPMFGPMTWNPAVARLIEARRLKPIEAARMHALISVAVSDIYAARRDVDYARGREHPCAPCAVGAAILLILESELGSASVPKAAATGTGTSDAVRGWTPVRDYADEWPSGQINGGTDSRGSIRAGEEMGRKIGLRALTYFRSIE